MATEKSLAIRRERALNRIAQSLGVALPQAQGRDPMMRLTVLLEALADATEAKRAAEQKEGQQRGEARKAKPRVKKGQRK